MEKENTKIILNASRITSYDNHDILNTEFCSHPPINKYSPQLFKNGLVFIDNKGKVKFNDEEIAIIKSRDIFAYSLKNGLLTIATKVHENDKIIIYTIDLKSKTTIKEKQLSTYNNTRYTYKDSDLEFSIIKNIDDKIVTMQYIKNKKTHRVIVPFENAFSARYYIVQNDYIVIHTGDLYVFSMDETKFINLGSAVFNTPGANFSWSGGWYIPFNEYVIYSPTHTFMFYANVYLYHYTEGTLYATRYQKTSILAKDTIETNIKKGNIYEQFLPLTKVENIDSIIKLNINSLWNMLPP